MGRSFGAGVSCLQVARASRCGVLEFYKDVAFRMYDAPEGEALGPSWDDDLAKAGFRRANRQI